MKFLVLLLAPTLVAGCGPMCDRITSGMCVVYNGIHVDHDTIVEGVVDTQEEWSADFGNVDIADLAATHDLMLIYENDEAFGYDDLSGYFSWDREHSVRPEIHIVYRDRYDDLQRCMTSYVLGHELLHFLVFTVGDKEDGHNDPAIWMEANHNWMLTTEYRIFASAADFCGLAL